jgi:hypothetical protein
MLISHAGFYFAKVTFIFVVVFINIIGSQTVSRATRGGGAVRPLGGGRVVCMMGIFILDEIWAQGKIYILISSLLG